MRLSEASNDRKKEVEPTSPPTLVGHSINQRSYPPRQVFFIINPPPTDSTSPFWERSGRVLDWRPRGCGIEPHRRHCVVSLNKNINPSLVLVQPRKTHPFITERLLMRRKESNLTITPILFFLASSVEYLFAICQMSWLLG